MAGVRNGTTRHQASWRVPMRSSKPSRGTPAPRWRSRPSSASGGAIERVWRGHVYEREVGPSDLLDVPEAAAALGLRHVFSGYRAIGDGRLEAIQRGRDILVPLAAIKAYLKHEASRPGRKGWRRLRD